MDTPFAFSRNFHGCRQFQGAPRLHGQSGSECCRKSSPRREPRRKGGAPLPAGFPARAAFAAALAAALSVQTGRPLKLSAAVKIAGKCKRRVHMEKTWTRLSPRFGKGGQMFYARFLSSAFSRYSPLASPPRRSNLAMRSAVLFSSSPCSATNHSRNWQARKSSLSRACL